MRIKCISVLLHNPSPEITHAGFTDVTHYLTLGKVYDVIAINWKNNLRWFLICDDNYDGQSYVWPIYFPELFFFIVDTHIPPYWINNEKFWGPKEFLDTSSLYYDLTKSKPEAVRAFKKLLLNILLSAPWHDSEIVDIVIDRSRPGVTDSVVLTINWTEEDYCNKLLFEKVYYVSLDLNFGVVCGEQGEPIDYVVNEHEDNALISSIKEKWNHKLDDVPLEYFKIKTSSTNSSIVIVAGEVRFV